MKKLKTQIVRKLKTKKVRKLEWQQNSKTETATKLKNLNCDQTQIQIVKTQVHHVLTVQTLPVFW